MPAVSDDELRSLRIFPLPGIALFPHAILPLHVFEPRYRALVRDCIDHGRLLAPWGIDPGAPETARGPGLHGVATAGRIRTHRELEDGRFDILVEGLLRVRLVGESDSGLPYRIVSAEAHPLEPALPGAVQAHVATLKSLAGTLSLGHPRAARLLQVTLDRCADPDELSDVLCAIAHDDPALRQHLLETSSVEERLVKVVETLSTLLLRAGSEGKERADVQ